MIEDPRVEALLPGEILVARHTDPGWIAVFANAAGVIAERGSLLSHSAIVAREMGVPCVVSLKGVTGSATLDLDEVARRIPLIREQEPLAEFLMVGNNPVARVKLLARQDGVTVTGFVEDVRPYLRDAMACVLPLRIARGVQNKLLEAMACGKAIIATPEAAAGLRVIHEEQLLIANSPNEFAAAVIDCIRESHLRESLGWRARRLVETEHAWQPLQKRLTDLIESVAQRSPETAPSKVRAIARH